MHISTPPELAAEFDAILKLHFVSTCENYKGFKEVFDGDAWGGWYNGPYAKFNLSIEEYTVLKNIFRASKRACLAASARAFLAGKERGKNALISLNMGDISEAEFLKF